ncbi:hypothetical protein LCGC14_2686100 [marine sediment metagenome]|uniref:Uncharacterized protein n=1 Tax=marine sediment metagenome TaxID=412755 RepID=A0A0F8ZJY2_9ZZZZ
MKKTPYNQREKNAYSQGYADREAEIRALTTTQEDSRKLEAFDGLLVACELALRRRHDTHKTYAPRSLGG